MMIKVDAYPFIVSIEEERQQAVAVIFNSDGRWVVINILFRRVQRTGRQV